MASALREAVELRMRLRSLSPRTHESYIHALEELARFYWRPLDTLECGQVQRFLDYLIKTTGRYFHLVPGSTRKRISPLDMLDLQNVFS